MDINKNDVKIYNQMRQEELFIKQVKEMAKERDIHVCVITDTMFGVSTNMSPDILSQHIKTISTELAELSAMQGTYEKGHPTFDDLYEYMSSCDVDIYGWHCLFDINSTDYPKWFLNVSEDKSSFFLCKSDAPSSNYPKKILEFKYRLSLEDFSFCTNYGIPPINKVAITVIRTNEKMIFPKDSNIKALTGFKFADASEVELIITVLEDIFKPRSY